MKEWGGGGGKEIFKGTEWTGLLHSAFAQEIELTKNDFFPPHTEMQLFLHIMQISKWSGSLFYDTDTLPARSPRWVVGP